ncbi:hypothetical protein E1301_Tti019874 [Triplophysa tibetana]|uniref:HMG domain-containing protein n=1 Tax=Triplophysa tibetana TaxID=1572043 RepID=A0A5A9NIA2_9TELE|nr:hypothetical protein E1301_Tti019874 [Triplophysa tibetana]
MAESVRHVTIQHRKKVLQLQKCKECCNSFHCPFCASNIFKPTRLIKLKMHLQSHCKKAIVHEDFIVHRCGLGCRPSLHYHCMFCTSTVLRRDDFKNHLQVCKRKQLVTIEKLSAVAATSHVTKETSSTSTETVTAPAVQQSPSSTSLIALLSITSTETVIAPAVQQSPSNNGLIASLANLKTTSPLTKVETPPTTAVYSSKVRVRPVVKKRCPICSALMNKCNLQKHIDRKHTEGSTNDINATSHLTSQCIDKTNGMFAVRKIAKGRSVPLHVQFKTWGETHRVLCDSSECQSNMELAQSSGLPSYQCKHIRSVTYCKSSAVEESLTDEVLMEMVRMKWINGETEKMCLAQRELAESHRAPLSVHTTIGVLPMKKCISVFEPNHSQLCRVMVVYNTKLNKWFCPCAKVRRSCTHKHVAQWHLFQTHRELFQPTPKPEESLTGDQLHYYLEGMDDTDDEAVYPPTGLRLANLVDYVFQNKKIPADLPENIRLMSTEMSYPRSLCPNESVCQICPEAVPLGETTLITQTAKILTNWRVIEDVAVYYKQCPQCEMCYRYQEWKDGLHNYNDDIILDIPLCLTLRNLLQVHTSVSRAVEFLQLMAGVEFPPPDTVLHAYLHFEALTEHEYRFSCVSCGDHPPVVIMGLHRQALQSSVKNIEEPPENFKGEIDVERFWGAVSKEMIARGFVESDVHNSFVVPPSLHFWAPWIGRNTRLSDTVLNTEFEKVHSTNSENLISEDRLTEELFKQKVDGIRSLCTDCGLDSTGSHSDLLLRLSNKMKSRPTFKKVFEKVWTPAGGWGVIMCPCGVVYSLRNNLRAESPQDFADLLLSWKHMPNVIIYEFAEDLAKHTNLRAPEQEPISPYEGCLAEPTTVNIDLARRGKLHVSLPWLQSRMTVADLHGHPVTGSSKHYVLYDQIPEGNPKDSGDALRNPASVPQLAGKVNRGILEQLFAEIKQNGYFLKMTSPSTQMFQMRNIIHHYNQQKNNKVINRMGDQCLVNLSYV